MQLNVEGFTKAECAILKRLMENTRQQHSFCEKLIFLISES